MDETWDRMWTLFHEARALSTEARAAFLDQACDGEAELRRQLDSLLDAEARSSGLLDGDAQDEIAAAVDDPMLDTRVGPYRIVDVLGEGGMGVVYLAEQLKPVRRRVALKVIKLGMDTREVLARFDVERQALVMMSHPNIAAAYDAGATEAGRPYFAMEHVSGRRLDVHCDRNRLPLRRRLELFVQVCKGVHHAHQRGVVHRDLKPSNVLVAERDGQTIAKVIDFGVAKATNQRLTEHTVFTEIGKTIGTPEYMSPEQADPEAGEIDARTDVYALGMLLYTLVAGTLPFDDRRTRAGGYEAIRTRIEAGDLPRPSARFDALDRETQDAVAARRATTTRQLRRMLREELDWIAVRALDHDRGARYASAEALAEDVERYLDRQPLDAAPRRPLRHLWQNLRKHPAQATIVLALAAVTMLLAWIAPWRTEGDEAIAAPATTPKDPIATRALAWTTDEVWGDEGQDAGTGGVATTDKRIAITLQSVPHMAPTLSLDRLYAMTDALLDGFTARDVQVVAFVNEEKLYPPDEVDARIAVLDRWLRAGHALGNQSYGHTSLHEAGIEATKEDVARGDTVSRQLAERHGQTMRYYRHPFLRTGLDQATRRAFETFLGQRGYVVAPVTIETSDWQFSQVYRRLLEEGDHEQARQVARAYLTFTDEVLTFFEEASVALLGRQVAHTLLLNATELNADTIEPLLALFHRRGYRFVTLDEALTDAAYTMPDSYFGASGPTWLYRWDWSESMVFDWSREPQPPDWIRALDVGH